MKSFLQKTKPLKIVKTILRIAVTIIFMSIPHTVSAFENSSLMQGLHLGVGVGYIDYNWQFSIIDNSPSIVTQPFSGIEVEPTSEIGYTSDRGTWIAGYKFKYTMGNFTLPYGDDTVTIQERANGRLTLALLGGLKLASNVATYLSMGYSRIYIHENIIDNDLARVSPPFPDIHLRAHGGTLAVGLRYYFIHQGFFDFSYNFFLYKSINTSLNWPNSTSSTLIVTGPHQISTAEIAGTLNVLFKI